MCAGGSQDVGSILKFFEGSLFSSSRPNLDGLPWIWWTNIQQEAGVAALLLAKTSWPTLLDHELAFVHILKHPWSSNSGWFLL
jgi:hypothetical protein